MKNILAILLTFILLTGAVPGGRAQADPGEPLSFGVLPVIQALPVFAAQELGLFKAEGLEVELVPFRTALDKDVAMTTRRINGYFGDLFTPIVLRAGGVDLRIVAVNFATGPDRRMFALLAGPKSGLTRVSDLAGVPVAVSTNTIIEYVTAEILERGGVPKDRIEFLETKSIPIRFQALMQGQAPAATLPEPLVTLAEKKGCVVLGDDKALPLSGTVLVFSASTIKNRPEDIRKFLAAIDQAVPLINSGLENIRTIMNQNCHLPEPLKKAYPIPKFPKLKVPAQGHVGTAVTWLNSRGVLKTTPRFNDLVDGGFIK